jgi:AcrR family transcriptional regulator
MSTALTPRARQAFETTQRILSVARQAFAAEGAANVSLDAIALQAGVTRGALHHHFTNKAGIFEAVLQKMDEEIGAEIDANWNPDLPSWQAWRACFHQYLDAVLHPDRLRLFFVDGPAILGARAFDLLLNSGLSDVVDGLRDPSVVAAITVDDPEALAHVLNGAAINLAIWVAADPDAARLPRAHAMLDALFDGISRTRAPD